MRLRLFGRLAMLSTLSPGRIDGSKIEHALHAIVPPLGGARYKGQSGRIGVVGGSLEYTGAPFYAAISALKLGADLSHVFCEASAGSAIKSYSPELIVHPILRSSESCADSQIAADDVVRWFRALDALVVGPGLGRDPALIATCAHVVRAAAEHGLPTVIDADGLRVVLDDPTIVLGERAVFVLTPNRAELARLFDKLVPMVERLVDAEDDSALAAETRTRQVAERLGPNVTLVVKGATDLIFDGGALLSVAVTGAPKRSGGQGDVLAGTLATWLAWSHADGAAAIAESAGVRPAALAAHAACTLTRQFARTAYSVHKRSMTAPDLIDAIGTTFEAWHPAPENE
jgi:ATP-dependent NAD(P)H-hydrate dehydratase